MIKNRLLSIILDTTFSFILFIIIDDYIIYIFKYAPIFFIIYFTVIEIIFCTSPGKWLVNLKIIQTGNLVINKRLLILFRGILKIITIFTAFGIILNIICIIGNKYSWYDKILGLSL